jgi:hypothetical protein
VYADPVRIAGQAPPRRGLQAPRIGGTGASEGAMKAAIASRSAVGVLALLALAATPGEAAAQDRTQRSPETVAPNLKRRPEPLPPSPRAERAAPEGEEAPSANEAAPPAGRGCPDQGRKLELIV